MYRQLLILVVLFFVGLANSAKISSTTANSTKISSTTVNPAKNNSTSVKPKINKNVPKGNITSRIGSGNRKVITTRLGSDGVPDQQCECTIFYLCDKDNAVQSSTTGERIDCESDMVCCAIPYLNEDTGSSAPTESPLPSSFSTYSPSLPEIISTEPNIQSSTTPCVCVPDYQCVSDDPLAIFGAGKIDPRISPCQSPNICCPESNWNPNIPPPSTSQPPASPTPEPTSPPTNPPTNTPYYPPDTPTPSVPFVYNPSDCGIRRTDVTSRITSSRETVFGEFPWMALILTTTIDPNGAKSANNFVCGASLVGPKIVLTAAHCVIDVNINNIKVRLGEYNTNDQAIEPAPHQEREVTGIYLHPKYHSTVLFNDIALLSVNQPFNITSHVFPVCIPLTNSQWSGSNIYDPNSCLATGWGKNAFKGNYQTTLKKVDLSIVPNDRCVNELRTTKLGQYFQLDSSFMCAAGKNGGDTCQGDGGGPLVCALKSDPNRYVQVGIVSWGIGCGDPIPAVYANLEANTEWLTEQYNILLIYRRS